jgi:hypothetical protein
MVLAIVKSADNSFMSQKFEIILKTVYSERIDHGNKYQRLLFLLSTNHGNKYQRIPTVN